MIFEYSPIIFAIVFIQTKMQILINPFYKLLREEKIMLVANMVGLVMAMLLVTSLYFATRSVTIVALSTLIAMAIRLYLSEIYLEKRLDIEGNKNIIFEIIGLTVFVFFAYQSNITIGSIGYFIIVVIYLFSQVKSIIRFTNYFFRR